jgi:hypothetical protein
VCGAGRMRARRRREERRARWRAEGGELGGGGRREKSSAEGGVRCGKGENEPRVRVSLRGRALRADKNASAVHVGFWATLRFRPAVRWPEMFWTRLLPNCEIAKKIAFRPKSFGSKGAQHWAHPNSAAGSS